MLNWFSLFYALPTIVALVVAGAIVGPRVNAPARTFLWSGIGVLSVAQLVGIVTSYLAIQRSLLSVVQIINVVVLALHITGTVLLIVAVGRAARPTLPPPNHPQQSYPQQSYGQQSYGQQPPYGQQPLYGRTQPSQQTPYGPGQPGQWGSGQQR